ncbi:hypothetical protein C6I21_07295 [Alkalicoccus urumqiensis]|uniref:Uncharacterized protein n=1 Tax=Alkalicoccus urumqiensis TaxID=1548213 RepID=A0A2P6MIH2_ALKUR|nr:hypothetical protein C6I21_07295 [Alkalicoccus urumqiensis]
MPESSGFVPKQKVIVPRTANPFIHFRPEIPAGPSPAPEQADGCRAAVILFFLGRAASVARRFASFPVRAASNREAAASMDEPIASLDRARVKTSSPRVIGSAYRVKPKPVRVSAINRKETAGRKTSAGP